MTRTLLSLNRALAAETGSVPQLVAAQSMNIAGDEPANPSVHGELSKALYAFPVEHYPFWRTVRAQARVAGWDDPMAPGSMGEDLTLSGLLEADVWIGDLLQFSECTLAVSEPRFPCTRFDALMGFSQASKLMVASGWSGFYLAVRVAGTLRAGETFELIPGPREVGITELFRARARAQKD